ncbi:hypothetical protein [Streptomyces sp. NPDC053367]|uniref:hypothetical protein n=1 Tax=Streptomyces sp. NPDC053367 TaxID=3365700 RepID=UPI0037D4CE9A
MTNPTDQPDLDQIEARANAATPGPWTLELEQCDCSDGYCHHGTYVSAIYAEGERRDELGDFSDDDWRFVIHARTDVPALVAEIRRLRAALTEIRHLHKDSPMGPCPVCIDADALTAGGDGLVPYPCPTARLAGAQDCDPPHRRAAGVVVPAASEETGR